MHNLIKTFREYLAVHPQLKLDGHTMDEIALGLARLVPACEISQTAVTGTFSADVPQGVPANLKPGKGYEAAGTSTSASAPKNVPAHIAVAAPDAVRDAEKLLRAEAARLKRIYGMGAWYGFGAEKKSHLEHLRVADALAATPAAQKGGST